MLSKRYLLRKVHSYLCTFLIKHLPNDLVRQEGLEPPTYWFVASHSIQLSYWRTFNFNIIAFKVIFVKGSKIYFL